MEINLNEIVNESMKEIGESGFVRDTVKNAIEETLKSTLNSTLGRWSKFGKSLESEIEEKIKVDLSKMNLSEYNQLVTNVVASTLQGEIGDSSIKLVKDNLEALFGSNDATVTLTELVKKMVEIDVDFDDEEYHEISFYFEGDENEENGFINISMDPEADKTSYGCKYKIGMFRNEIFSLEIEGVDARKIMSLNNVYGFSKELFCLYAKRAKIIIDDSNIDTEVLNPDCEEW
ncbi:hypothetical protein JKT90_01530 [Listeria monocytogenes]|nr:hypothetical protein [Listeria monocytogenes]MCP6825376.1 hypothetical protein [Listeria monocytogenes]MCP6898430.1 hypothetical protein [Listeria monocytogenes]MCP6904720.1 hypothetical protein [Listeria monocytogenes]MCP6916256.1 hypothetical protein [Listeria monocytogenes]